MYHEIKLLLFKSLKCSSFRSYQSLSKYQVVESKRLLDPFSYYVIFRTPNRELGLIARLARNVLRLRYLVLGGAVGGGIQASKKFEEWKNNLPDFSWISEMIDDSNVTKKYHEFILNTKQTFNSEKMKSLLSSASDKIDLWNQWIQEAKEARKVEKENSSSINENSDPKKSQPKFFTTKYQQDEKEKMQKLQDLMNIQIKYQREIEKLEKENKELKRQLMLNLSQNYKKREVKKSLIDMYSDVLDELSDYDLNYCVQDHLPKVVVIGDQSAGKTSVLEMIAGARIFPRGAGEMMTRAPVKVTLSESPYHVAKFKDSSREFDLTKESDLRELRQEVELRMLKSVEKGKAISKEVIAMTVQGPGIPRMVLIDLPGIISVSTIGMAPETREVIKDITKSYISNPNAIILCIQDGSIDAERSIVTELVSQIDPNGKRTIFVLTKVDLAEKNMANPSRIKKILDGKLFPMKALGYFAVVTGKGQNDESIDFIKKYEEDFFKNSQLCKNGILNISQCSTQNLSFAVSECFWKMVKASVVEQADTFKAIRYNFEAEWRNNFPTTRELDRNELFKKAKEKILDEIVNLSLLDVKHWDNVISKTLCENLGQKAIKNMFLPIAHVKSKSDFRTYLDIKLKEWVERSLPSESINIGNSVIHQEFINLINTDSSKKKYDDLLDNLIKYVINEAWKNYIWEPKALNILKIIQLNALEDCVITNKNQWFDAIAFSDNILNYEINKYKNELNLLVGPGMWEKWFYWKSSTQEQNKSAYIKSELESLLTFHDFETDGPKLSKAEETTIKKNLQTKNVEVDITTIRKVWDQLYAINMLTKTLNKNKDCRRCFEFYQQGFNNVVDCDHIIFFWRIQKMLSSTTNSLRQQVMQKESRNVEKELKNVLDDIGLDEEKKVQLLKGKRIELVEKLKRVKLIQKKLEDFIAALSEEK